ncbi:hypothetical protein ZHAS_00006821 [Anopheles sinensis]|uniref:Uncharacterized protein n=1 Tax=Anopheles sinensis TaxID=74873 RepID=A0A084VN50_ANOSI|nr:hypothetical protein ZHAS_00006821 [Anopheles sinensis]
MPGADPDANPEYALEEHAYARMGRRTRDARNESEWSRQARQSTSVPGLFPRRDSIGGLSTQSQPVGGPNYSSLGLQSPAPSYRSQGNYAPGVTSAVVADMREVLRVREASMTEHVKVMVTQELLPLQLQISRMQSDIAEIKRDIRKIDTTAQVHAGRLETLERDVVSLKQGSNVLVQSLMMALSLGGLDGPNGQGGPSNQSRPPPPLMHLLQSYPHRADEQHLYGPPPPMHYSQNIPLPGVPPFMHSMMPPPPPPPSSVPLMPHPGLIASPSAGVSGISPLSSGSRSLSGSLQRGDIRHLEAVFDETVGHLTPHSNGDYSDLREVELRRELQDAVAAKSAHQARINMLQHSLNLVSQERNGTPYRARTATVTRGSMEQEQQQQQQQHQHGGVSGIGPVTDL